MGLRTASVRHPHVEVMAPALTETTKLHFKLHSRERLESPVEIYSDNRFLNYKQSFFPLNELKTNPSVVEGNNESICGKFTDRCLKQIVSQTGINHNIVGSINMNNLQSPLSHDNNKIGLQKNTSISPVKRQKMTKNMEQVLSFSDLRSDGSDSEFIHANDLGSHVDDMIDVFKSMTDVEKSNSAGKETEIFSVAATHLENNLSPFEKDFLENVDVMGIEMEDQREGDVDIQNDYQANELLTQIEKKLAKTERKLDFLRRRAYKLQSKLLGQHISYEISGIYENVYRHIKKSKDLYELNTPGLIPSQNFTEKMKPLSSSSIKNLLKKLDVTSVLQAKSIARQKLGCKYFGSGSVEISLLRNASNATVNVLPWSIEEKCELHRIARHLKAQLSLTQQEIDSEATESSSGGESCDELQNYSNPHQQYLSVQKRALWKYSTERALIAARWTWLQAQIADIEYRIRLHSDLHKQMRTSKGPIELEDTDLHTMADTSPTTVNGYLGHLPGSSMNSTKLNSDLPKASSYEFQCARTRPLKMGLKKRKLLQITSLHAVSKRAARPSTMKCGCVPLSVPCALCTGRSDPTHPRDAPDTLSISEKIALLDPTFHPVFSLSEDTSQRIHLEAIMKTSEWQQKSSRVKTAKVFTKLDGQEMKQLDRNRRNDHRRKFGKLLKTNTVSVVSEKNQHRTRGRKPSKNSFNRLHGKKFIEKEESPSLNTITTDTIDDEIESISNNSNSGPKTFDSPSSSPLLQIQSITCYNKKGRIDSYDIDNIVIPYSVAASTRVEKLQYKEILTPKWRIAEPCYESLFIIKNNGVRDYSFDSDVEDLTEDAVLTRHDKCEYEEKKRFLSYLKLPVGYGRSRSHKRTDSRAESSGANTPDPMSPHNLDQQDNNSPMNSPPATPSSFHLDEGIHISSIVMRRRTMSQSKIPKDKEVKEEFQTNIADIVEVVPYDKRSFPITDETYDKMLKNMPENHKFTTNSRSQDSSDQDEISYLDDERTGTPDSESTESAVGDGEEDPNDPEWSDMERINREKYKR